MIWYWYSSRDNEIFIDCDRWKESVDHIRIRLQGAIEHGKLIITSIYSFETSENHRHVIILIDKPIQKELRSIWAMVLHSDIYRAASNLARMVYDVNNPDILIAKKQYHRQPDAICHCERKHKLQMMLNCPAAIALRGTERTTTFFGKPSKNPCQFL